MLETKFFLEFLNEKEIKDFLATPLGKSFLELESKGIFINLDSEEDEDQHENDNPYLIFNENHFFLLIRDDKTSHYFSPNEPAHSSIGKQNGEKICKVLNSYSIKSSECGCFIDINLPYSFKDSCSFKTLTHDIYTTCAGYCEADALIHHYIGHYINEDQSTYDSIEIPFSENLIKSVNDVFNTPFEQFKKNFLNLIKKDWTDYLTDSLNKMNHENRSHFACWICCFNSVDELINLSDQQKDDFLDKINWFWIWECIHSFCTEEVINRRLSLLLNQDINSINFKKDIQVEYDEDEYDEDEQE